MILSLALALTLTWQTGNVDISEQQLTQYVNSKVKYEQDYALPGLFDAHVKLSRMEVGLARSAARQADVQGFGSFTLTLPNKPVSMGQCRLTSRPCRYVPSRRRRLLRPVHPANYVLRLDSLNQQFGPMMGYPAQGIEQRLTDNPPTMTGRAIMIKPGSRPMSPVSRCNPGCCVSRLSPEACHLLSAVTLAAHRSGRISMRLPFTHAA